MVSLTGGKMLRANPWYASDQLAECIALPEIGV